MSTTPDGEAACGHAGRHRHRGIYLQNNVWGTPEACIEKLELILDDGRGRLRSVFSYGSMPLEKAEASMKLFAEKVLPKVRDGAGGGAGAGS